MLAIGDINISTVDGDNENVVPDNNEIVNHELKGNNSDIDALAEGGEFYAEMDRLIATFVQLEKDHLISRKN